MQIATTNTTESQHVGVRFRPRAGRGCQVQEDETSKTNIIIIIMAGRRRSNLAVMRRLSLPLILCYIMLSYNPNICPLGQVEAFQTPIAVCTVTQYVSSSPPESYGLRRYTTSMRMAPEADNASPSNENDGEKDSVRGSSTTTTFFSDNDGASSTLDHSNIVGEAQFGQAVPLRKPSSATAAAAASTDTTTMSSPLFADDATGTAPSSALFSTGSSIPISNRGNRDPQLVAEASNDEDDVDYNVLIRKQRRKNLVVAVLSVILSVSNYLWQYAHPVTPLQILSDLQHESAPMSIIGRNSKPTLVDFWAPWCENCKAEAPTLQTIEREYKDRVNFISINGDAAAAWPYIEAFGVDAIPHIALVTSTGDVETALIGPIPKHIIAADLDALIDHANKQQRQKEEGQLLSSTTSSSSALLCTAVSDCPDGQQQEEPLSQRTTKIPKEERVPLPYKMLDVFASHPQDRRVHFDSD